MHAYQPRLRLGQTFSRKAGPGYRRQVGRRGLPLISGGQIRKLLRSS